MEMHWTGWLDKQELHQANWVLLRKQLNQLKRDCSVHLTSIKRWKSKRRECGQCQLRTQWGTQRTNNKASTLKAEVAISKEALKDENARAAPDNAMLKGEVAALNHEEATNVAALKDQAAAKVAALTDVNAQITASNAVLKG